MKPKMSFVTIVKYATYNEHGEQLVNIVLLSIHFGVLNSHFSQLTQRLTRTIYGKLLYI